MTLVSCFMPDPALDTARVSLLGVMTNMLRSELTNRLFGTCCPFILNRALSIGARNVWERRHDLVSRCRIDTSPLCVCAHSRWLHDLWASNDIGSPICVEHCDCHMFRYPDRGIETDRGTSVSCADLCNCGLPHGDGDDTVFFVSAMSRGRVIALLGPYRSHGAALDDVDRGHLLALKVDPRASWYSYGTVALPGDTNTVGLLEPATA